VTFAREATVKSHASYKLFRAILARASATKIRAYRAACERSRAGSRRLSRSRSNHFGAPINRPPAVRRRRSATT
jgi:hypothetical protein